MADLSIEQLRSELASLRNELGQFSSSPVADTEWSAHANWKNKSSSLLGDYDFSSRLRIPQKADVHPMLEKVINDSSNERFIEVANSLKKIMEK